MRINCECGAYAFTNLMCSKCGNIHRNNGNLDIEETNERIIEFLVFNDFTVRDIYRDSRNYPFFIDIHNRRKEVQNKLSNIPMQKIIKTRHKVIKENGYDFLPEKMFEMLEIKFKRKEEKVKDAYK